MSDGSWFNIYIKKLIRKIIAIPTFYNVKRLFDLNDIIIIKKLAFKRRKQLLTLFTSMAIFNLFYSILLNQIGKCIGTWYSVHNYMFTCMILIL